MAVHPPQMLLADCTDYSGQLLCAAVLKLSLVGSTVLEARSGGSVLELWETKKTLNISLSPIPDSAGRIETLVKKIVCK